VILEVDDVSKRFGALAALTRVSFGVEAGQVFSVIGPNGAGKSTLFNVVSGLFAPNTGRVRFRGEDITGLPPERLASGRPALTFPMQRIFSEPRQSAALPQKLP